MNVIIQKDLFIRSREEFSAAAEKYGIRFLQTEVLDEEAMLKHHQESAGCFVIGVEAYSAGFYSSLKENSAVIRYGVGYNAVPLEICREKKIKVAYTPGTLTDSVAEHTFALLLCVCRKMPEMNESLRNGKWRGRTGLELKGKTLALIGYGQIGRAVARIAKYGFGMTVAAFDSREDPGEGPYDLYSNDFAKAVRRADVVSLHLATTPSTIGFIDKVKISQMKDGAVLINTARGELIVEDDLYEALKSGKILTAGLDVFVNEPYVPLPGADLRTLDNVVLSPHCGSNTKEASKRMAEMVIENILAYFSGEEMIIVPEMVEPFSDH